jgi:hypothetical protein
MQVRRPEGQGRLSRARPPAGGAGICTSNWKVTPRGLDHERRCLVETQSTAGRRGTGQPAEARSPYRRGSTASIGGSAALQALAARDGADHRRGASTVGAERLGASARPFLRSASAGRAQGGPVAYPGDRGVDPAGVRGVSRTTRRARFARGLEDGPQKQSPESESSLTDRARELYDMRTGSETSERLRKLTKNQDPLVDAPNREISVRYPEFRAARRSLGEARGCELGLACLLGFLGYTYR